MSQVVACWYANQRDLIREYLAACGLGPKDSGKPTSNDLHVNTARQARGSTKDVSFFLAVRRNSDDRSFQGQTLDPGQTCVNISRMTHELHILLEDCPVPKDTHLEKLTKILFTDPDVIHVYPERKISNWRECSRDFYDAAVGFHRHARQMLTQMQPDSDDENNGRDKCDSFFQSVSKMKNSLMFTVPESWSNASHDRTRHMPTWVEPEDVSTELWNNVVPYALRAATAICHTVEKKAGSTVQVKMTGVHGVVRRMGFFAALVII